MPAVRAGVRALTPRIFFLLSLAGLCLGAAPMPGVVPPVPMPAHARPAPPQQPAKVQLSEAEAAALPEGEGRDAVANMCVSCHGVLVVTAERHTAAGWTVVVEDMRDKGAAGTDEQAEAVGAYLARHFPAVNVNTADAAALTRVLKLTDAESAAIVAYRASNPPFKTVDDLKRVPGVDPATIDRQRAAITFSGK